MSRNSKSADLKNIFMKIVYITDSFAICGGIERVLTDKMNYLAANYGYDVSLLTIYQGNHPFPFVLDERIRYIDIDVRNHQQYEYSGLIKYYKKIKLRRLIKHRLISAISDIRPDIIVCVKIDMIGLMLSVRGGIPLVAESHTICRADEYEKNSFLHKAYLWFVKRKVRNLEALVALTDDDASEWRHFSSHVFVIPNIVHPDESATNSKCQSKSIMFVGRFSKQKNVVALLNIWENIFQRNPDWELHVYGEKGDIEETVYNRLIAAQEIGIVIHNPVKEHMLEEYKNHSVLVLTSVFEPFGLVITEAMSCGLPVVAYDCPYGPASIITDEKDGFLIKYGDEACFVERLCQLMADASLRQEMGKYAIASSKRYAEDSIMPLWKKLFEDIINKNPKLC